MLKKKQLMIELNDMICGRPKSTNLHNRVQVFKPLNETKKINHVQVNT